MRIPREGRGRSFGRAAPLALTGLLAACGTAQSVRPLGAGRQAVDASVGGPVVRAFPVPAPISLVGYRYGIDDRSDVFGRFHLVPAAFGRLAFEAGASRLLLEERGPVPAVSASAQALCYAGPGAFAIPAFSVNASWSTGRWVFYGGSQQAVSWGRRLEGSGAAFHWSPYVGATLDQGRWTFGAELRWLELQLADDALVWWQGFLGRGAIAPMLSVQRRFGGER